MLPCLRDHNSKVALGALEILELLVSRVPESTLRLYAKQLWASLEERLGDSKLLVRKKAVDVIVEVSIVLDVNLVLDKLKDFMKHKNWRAREQSLHAVWRCLEKHNLFEERHEELLDDVLKLLEDSSKDVRDASVSALEKFYAFLGSSLLRNLEHKKIRTAHMKTLTDRFRQIQSNSLTMPLSGAASTRSDIFPQKLSSIVSSPELQASSSSSMARYLASVRTRKMKEAKTVDANASEAQSLSHKSSTSSQVVNSEVLRHLSGNDISEKEITRELNAIFDKLELENSWDIRVIGLKLLQELASRCSKASNSGCALSILTQGLCPIRERLCLQVSDLRSSVSREACETIQTLANTLRDEFNAHAETCLENLLKATCVSIQVVSTSADTTIKIIITSTSYGFPRVIPKLIECVKSRNQVLRCNAVSYLTLTLQKWSISFLSKHSELFVPIMPAILQDALGDVRAQSRKCYWSFHYLFPEEAKNIFHRLDRSTQKNLSDDPSRLTAKMTRPKEFSSMNSLLDFSSQNTYCLAIREPLLAPSSKSVPVAVNSVVFCDEGQHTCKSDEATNEKLPRRVLGEIPASIGKENNAQLCRMLPQGPMRIGPTVRADSPLSKNNIDMVDEVKSYAASGPLRVWSAPRTSQLMNATAENMNALRQAPSKSGSQTSSQHQSSKAQRVQLTAESYDPALMEINEVEVGPKRLPILSMPPPTASSASSSKANIPHEEFRDRAKTNTTLKKSERPRAMSWPETDLLENAIRNIEDKTWSTRLEAAECIGKFLQERVNQRQSDGSEDDKFYGQIFHAFIEHLSDSHHRVSQEVLKNLPQLLKLSHDSQRLLPQLKLILPKLFQKFIDTKESTRAAAKESLEYIAIMVDSSTLAAILISMLGYGSNMKVKAAMCHFLREVLPGAEGYMKAGTNGSHMKAFLLKIAQLMNTDVPVSVSSACGELVSAAAQLYGSEMEEALGLLSPNKRSTVIKVLKSKNIVFKPERLESSLATASHYTQLQEADKNIEDVAPPAINLEKSRKRAEAPSVNSSSSTRQTNQKRINTLPEKNAPHSARSPLRSIKSEVINRVNASLIEKVSLSSPVEASMDKHGLQLEEILCLLEQNDLSAMDLKRTLFKTLHLIEAGVPETWDRCYGRLLLLLLDTSTEENLSALQVLHRLVICQPTRAQLFFDLLLQRLTDAMVDQGDEACHLMERILFKVVTSSSDYEQTLLTLLSLDSCEEPPQMQVVLRLIKGCLRTSECGNPRNMAFMRNNKVTSRLFSVITRCLGHTSSSVRKCTVDCLVAFYFATKDDSSIVSKFLAELNNTQRRLVEIFIERAKIEQQHIGGLSLR